VLRHDKLLNDILQGRMLGKTTRERRIQLTDDLSEKKKCTDLKNAAEDRSVLRKIKDCHKPA